MKKHILLVIMFLFLSGILMAACGGKEEGKEPAESVWKGIAPGMEDLTAITERTEYYDVAVESEALFELGMEASAARTIALGGSGWLPMGTQFFRGEPVQLWADAAPEESDIYLYRKDGSRELLLEDFSTGYVASQSKPSCRWYMDQDGGYYCYGGIYQELDGMYSESAGFLARILSSGEVLYEAVLEPGIFIRGLCQAEDGRVYLLLVDRTEDKMYGVWKLAEADSATGEPVAESVRELPWKFEVYLGKAGDFPAAMGYNLNTDRQISGADLEEGSLSPILYFTGLSYGWHDDLTLQDFQVRKDGVIEFLWTGAGGAGGLLERLEMEKVEKIPIVVRGRLSGNKWFGNRVIQFNRENSTYHVVVEDCGSGNNEEDFARLTSIQIGAGGGPDIINGSLMRDYMEGLLDKGALEDLTPYMEVSGVREEEYFPLAFGSLRQGEHIYGVNYNVIVWDYKVAADLPGSREMPDIEKLADALLAREGEGRYCRGYDAGEVLRVFLQGSEDLWGMVDWESGSCEFHTPLFGKLLEAAGRYGDDGRKNMESIAVYRSLSDVLELEGLTGTHETEFEGKVTSGILFDDGCHAAYSWAGDMSINANSSHKEGAWEFIRFLISEEAQSADFRGVWFPPVHREAFDAWEQWFLNQYTNVHKEGLVSERLYNGRPVTDEMLVEFRERIEDARPLPFRTVPLLDIILEEAEDYFNGFKSAEEVSGVINRRVQLYLDERK